MRKNDLRNTSALEFYQRWPQHIMYSTHMTWTNHDHTHSHWIGSLPIVMFSAIPRTTITPAVEGDPHVRVQHAEEEPVCFDIDDEDGSVLDLISDLDTGLEVNGQLISASQKKHVSRLERVGILTPYGIEIGIYPDRVTLGQGFRTLQVFLFDE